MKRKEKTCSFTPYFYIQKEYTSHWICQQRGVLLEEQVGEVFSLLTEPTLCQQPDSSSCWDIPESLVASDWELCVLAPPHRSVYQPSPLWSGQSQTPRGRRIWKTSGKRRSKGAGCSWRAATLLCLPAANSELLKLGFILIWDKSWLRW